MKNPSSIPVSFANKLNCSEIATGISQLFTLAWELRISIVTAPGGNLTDWEKRYGNEEEGDQEIAQGKANRANQTANTL
jgi:hypothetical protein